MARNWSIIIAILLLCGPTNAASAVSAADDGILDAARRDDLETVRALAKSRLEVNATQPDGATALHWAAHWDDVAMAELLLKAGARVNVANAYGATPLWLASVNGSVAMTEKLLQWDANPNVALHYGETPLITAARAGAVNVVRALLAKGANVDAKEAARGQTALMWAAAEGQLDVMRALVEGGASVTAPSKSGFTPLLFVARQGSIDAARFLLAHGAPMDAPSTAGATPLLTAVVRGHVDLAEFLLDRGADPNASGTGYMPLHWVAGTWETSVTTDYTFTDSEEWAATRGVPLENKARLIRALVAHGADVNARTVTEPPRTGYTLILSMPQKLRKGATPFYIAAVAADVPIMRLLVTLGADPSIRSDNNTTALMVAAGRMRIDYETRIREEDALAAVKLAVDLGNDVHLANDDGETALHAAAIGGMNSVVQYLVDQGASLSPRMNDGRTPLALAEVGYGYATLLVQRPHTAALLRKLGAE